MSNILTQNEKKIRIAVGVHRWSKSWKNQETTWSELVERLKTPARTGETVTEYQKASKSRKGRAKDVGGFVGGTLKGGRRVNTAVLSRSLVCLDADNADQAFIDALKNSLPDTAWVLYSTHGHTPEKPRYRVVIPLSHDVKPDMYQPIARRIAADIGIEYFDPSMYDITRMFYWPSCPSDGEFIYENHDGQFLAPDTVLDRYPDWTDAALWPQSKAETDIKALTTGTRQGNPAEKPGVIGAFCRAYPVRAALAEFLPDVYTPTADPDRYTYAKGSTHGGMIVYDKETGADFVYSHHGTDPAGGRLCNSFDLVRIHKFGDLDADIKEGTPINRCPSFRAMSDWCFKQEKVVAEFDKASKEAVSNLWDDGLAKEGTNSPAKADTHEQSWATKLTRNKKGDVDPTSWNLLSILENDPLLKGTVGYNDFAERIAIRGELPWRKHAVGTGWTDADDACLRNYLSVRYGITGKQVIDDALTQTIRAHHFHPVREYLNHLEWDGTPRAETLYVDYLGAADTKYVRTVTLLHLKGAVARILHPGIKFDVCLVLTGPQGIGKTTVIAKLGGEWFNESITNLQGKDALEQLLGTWCVELSEMQATRKAENDQIKAFLSRQVDKFRSPYGHRTEEHPRQCVFWATTNEELFLKDRTGSRRFWVVDCSGDSLFEASEIDSYTRDQIWAEVYTKYREDPSLLLPRNLEDETRELQEQHSEGHETLGIILGYLDTSIPANWNKKTITERVAYYENGDDVDDSEVLRPRTEVCCLEIWCEAFGGKRATLTSAKAREINAVLQHVPGWSRYSRSKSGRKLVGPYGYQTVYVREKKEDGKTPKRP